MAGFMDFLNPQAEMEMTPAPMPGMGFAAQQQPVPPEIQQMRQPTNDPNEIEMRKQGWMQVIQRVASDPNVSRALGYFGASALQPIPYGQRPMGHLANAAMTGVAAYDYGTAAQREQERQRLKDAMEIEKHGVEVEGARARTEGTRTETAGKRTQNIIAERTMEDVIAEAKTKKQAAEVALSTAITAGDKAKIELDYTKYIRDVEMSIPAGERRKAIIAELKKADLENLRTVAQTQQARAAAGASGAAARKSAADAAAQELENKDLAGLTPAERQAQRNRKGNTSAQVQMLEAYKTNWRAANPGKSEQEVAAAADRYLVQAKARGEDKEFIDWAGLYGTGNYDKDLEAFYKARGKKFTETPGGATTGREAAVAKPQTEAEYRALPKGTRFVRPGETEVRIKQ